VISETKSGGCSTGRMLKIAVLAAMGEPVGLAAGDAVGVGLLEGPSVGWLDGVG
jgi:hypothetical protein